MRKLRSWEAHKLTILQLKLWKKSCREVIASEKARPTGRHPIDLCTLRAGSFNVVSTFLNCSVSTLHLCNFATLHLFSPLCSFNFSPLCCFNLNAPAVSMHLTCARASCCGSPSAAWADKHAQDPIPDWDRLFGISSWYFLFGIWHCVFGFQDGVFGFGKVYLVFSKCRFCRQWLFSWQKLHLRRGKQDEDQLKRNPKQINPKQILKKSQK